MDTNVLPAFPASPLVLVDHVRQLYPRGGGDNVLVLDDVTLSSAQRRDRLAARSLGLRQLSLLRIIAGLMPPSAGSVTIGEHPVAGPATEVAMVFQTFALFPG